MDRTTFLGLSLLGSALLGCGAAVQGLSDYTGPSKDFHAGSVTASAYVPRLDLLALGYRDGTLELRAPAPRHLLSSGRQQSTISSLALSPNGERLASVDARGAVLISEVADGTYRRFEIDTSSAPSAPRGPIVGLAWDQDGRRLAVAAGTRLQLIDTRGDTSCETVLAEPVGAVAFSTRAQEIVAAGRRLTFLSVPELEQLRQVELPGFDTSSNASSATDVRFSLDGALLGVVLPGGVAFMDLQSTKLDAAPLPKLDPIGLRFDDTGKVVVFGRRGIYLGQPKAAEIEGASRETQGELAAVEFRQDGSLLLLGDVADAEVAALLH
jgi:hypothetical protein